MPFFSRNNAMESLLLALTELVRAVIIVQIMAIGVYVMFHGAFPRTFKTPVGTFAWRVFTWPLRIIFGGRRKKVGLFGLLLKGIGRLFLLPVWLYKTIRFITSGRRVRKRLRRRRF